LSADDANQIRQAKPANQELTNKTSALFRMSDKSSAKSKGYTAKILLLGEYRGRFPCIRIAQGLLLPDECLVKERAGVAGDLPAVEARKGLPEADATIKNKDRTSTTLTGSPDRFALARTQ